VIEHQHTPADETCSECRLLKSQGIDIKRFGYVEHLTGYTAFGPKIDAARILTVAISGRVPKFFR
jgi:hypothetical protein